MVVSSYGPEDLQGAITEGLKLIMTRIQEDIDAQDGEIPEYMLSLKLRAASYWWPSLRRLQMAAPTIEKQQLSAKSRCRPVSALLDRWIAFGALLGLDMDEERRRHGQDQQRRCWWRGCQYQPTVDGTTVKLLQCAGCGEARYCNKECQRLYVESSLNETFTFTRLTFCRDWKTGGHKQMCRRLK